MRLINTFLRSELYNKLPIFVVKKIFKYTKIFFVETDLKELPITYHHAKLDLNYQKRIITDSNKDFFKSNISCNYLLEVLKIYSQYKKKINFFDFGANNIDNYIYLSKNLEELNYYYYDQESYRSVIETISKEHNFKNFITIKNLDLSKLDIDFAFFGSSLQYIDNFEDVLKKFISKKVEYIFITLTPFYTSSDFSNNLIFKQVNVAEHVLYSYFFNYGKFIKIFENESYELVFSKPNLETKFLNFKNFEKTYKSVHLLDLLFRYKHKVR